MIIPWPFSPLVLRPALWLDASDASTLYSGASLAAADGAISEWRDKSGNARHATQATGVSQPLRKTALKNGRDVVRFDGANDFMQNSVPSLGTTACTIIRVAKSTRNDGVEICVGPNSTKNSMGVSRHTTGETKGYVYGSVQTLSSITSNFSLASLVLTAADVKFYYNGGSAITSAVTGVSLGVGFTVGALRDNLFGVCMAGDSAEILVFPTALSDAERLAVENYLNAKWAIY